MMGVCQVSGTEDSSGSCDAILGPIALVLGDSPLSWVQSLASLARKVAYSDYERCGWPFWCTRNTSEQATLNVHGHPR